jgi:hypothetical protein
MAGQARRMRDPQGPNGAAVNLAARLVSAEGFEAR